MIPYYMDGYRVTEKVADLGTRLEALYKLLNIHHEVTLIKDTIQLLYSYW
jgi:hypothetical protein